MKAAYSCERGRRITQLRDFCCNLNVTYRHELLRRVMCNELDQQVRQVTKRSAQRSVDSLGAGISCDLGRQARQQPAQRLRPMALHAEEVLQLADHPFYDLALA